jgi:uncharacterized membrane protein
MTLDIRLPMGLLFTLIGLLLVMYGLTHAPLRPAAGVNVNADWGAVLIVLGVSMLLLARRHTARVRRRAG